MAKQTAAEKKEEKEKKAIAEHRAWADTPIQVTVPREIAEQVLDDSLKTAAEASKDAVWPSCARYSRAALNLATALGKVDG